MAEITRQTLPGAIVLAGRVILVITRLGAGEGGALDKMAALARATGARLRLAYCPNPSSGLGRPLSRLKQRARHLGRILDRPVETVEAEIRTAADLREHVADCSLVCIARSEPARRPGDSPWRLPDALIELRTQPVLILGHGHAWPYASTLVPVSLGPNSAELLSWAAAMAPQSSLELLHVADMPELATGQRPPGPPSVMEQVLQDAWRELRQRLRGLSARRGHGPDAPTHTLVHGDVPDAIRRCQTTRRHHLVVLGNSSRKTWRSFLWPGLAPRLMHWLNCDVMVIPQAPARRRSLLNWLGS